MIPGMEIQSLSTHPGIIVFAKNLPLSGWFLIKEADSAPIQFKVGQDLMDSLHYGLTNCLFSVGGEWRREGGAFALFIFLLHREKE